MNMFRTLFTLFLIFIGVSLMVSTPSDWPLVQRMGPDFLEVVKGAQTFRPFVIGACIVTAVALFMTRKQY